MFTRSHLHLSRNQSLQLRLNGIQVAGGRDPRSTVGLTLGQGQVLGHDTVVDGVNASLLQSLGEGDQLGSAVKLSTLDETPGPRENGGNGVGGGLLSPLVLAPVTSDSSVG
jgi:hypothetical protein